MPNYDTCIGSSWDCGFNDHMNSRPPLYQPQTPLKYPRLKGSLLFGCSSVDQEFDFIGPGARKFRSANLRKVQVGLRY